MQVTLWQSAYDKDAATQGASCMTGADGACTLTTPSSKGGQLSAVVDAGAQGQVHVPALETYYEFAPSPYVGALVLDRALVRPNDTLHFTGG